MARYFIIIGNAIYDDKNISNLEFVENDVKDLNIVLEKHGNYDEIKIIKNKVVREAKKELLEFQKKIKMRDEIFLYFSGHGYIDDNDDELYFVFKDSEFEYMESTSLESSFITKFLNNNKANVKAFILDACFSGGMMDDFAKSVKSIEKVKSVNNKFISSTKGTFGLMSSRRSETSLGNDERSIFTDYIIKGIESGEACYSKSEFISLNELWTYIDKNFPKEKHVPQIFQKGEGSAYISRNPNYIEGQEPIKFVNNPHNIIQLVDEYKKSMIREFEELKMIGFKSEFKLEDIYIPLSVQIDKDSVLNCHKNKFTKGLRDKQIKAEELVKLDNIVSVVLGLPGMGKTTMLHYLSLKECEKDKGLIPVFIKLSEFSKSGEYLESYITTRLKENFKDSNVVSNMIKSSEILVLLDGLDEVNRDNYNDVVEKIKVFINSNENCRIVITSRIAGFQYHRFNECIFEIDELPNKEIEKFINKWFKENKPELINCIMENERILELARNPFLLSIICVVYEKDSCLPRRRVELYKRCTETLLNLYQIRKVENKSVFSQGLKEEVLSEIAFEFFSKDMDEFPYSNVYRIVKKVMSQSPKVVNEDDILKEICENSGILQDSDGKYLFVHRTFFEYYVAFRYKYLNNGSASIMEYVSSDKWTEPVCLYAAMIDNKKDGTAFLTKLWRNKKNKLALMCYSDMDNVIDDSIIREMLKSKDVDERIDIVKGLTYKIKDLDVLVDIIDELFNVETNGEVIYWCVEILERLKSEKCYEKAKRIIFDKLDNGADVRREELLKDNLIYIEKGKFQMGGKRDNEKPIHEVELSEFYMCKYQITNIIYEKFDPEHRNKRNEQSDKDDQPVIYVNWYEAHIFSRWIGCELPTEAQWEYACRAGTTTEFNTGNKLTTKQANFDNKIGKTTPVGKYKLPNKWGLHDMHGNVYEWCKDWYDEEYYNKCNNMGVNENPENIEIGSPRVLRGGYWDGSSVLCRSAFRDCGDPDFRDDFVGIRLIFRPSV